MQALVTPGLTLRTIDRPSPGRGHVLVKISHAAQNPTDVQSFDTNMFGDGAVYGCDFVGEVVELGTGVTRIKAGDVVSALIWGGETKGVGAYGQYCLADEKICFAVPKDTPRAQAATIPLAAATAWLALFSDKCLNMDRNRKQTVLVWGGSSSVGQYTIQLAALFSFNVITTCSPRNFDLVKKLGASHAFDYKSPDVVEQIKAAAPDVSHIFDTIGNDTSAETALKSSRSPAFLCSVRPGRGKTEAMPADATLSSVLVWTAFLKDHSYGKFHWPASEADHKLSSELFEKLPELLETRKFIPNDVYLLRGLESVQEGFDMYRHGKYSAQKVVYEI